MHGFKAFNFNMSCRYIKYTLGQESTHTGPLRLCESGLHFCKELANVFTYYSSGIFCQVEIPTDAEVLTKDDKSVTNKLTPTSLLEGKYESLGNTYYFKSGKLDNDDGPTITLDGAQYWYKEGQLHRDGDLPAIIYTMGTQVWCKHDKLHRDGDQPAIIHADGAKVWCKHDKYHRDGDLPAVIHADGAQAWYKHDKCHRDGDLPSVIHADGSQEWFQHGNRHRDNDNPAKITSTYTEWYKNDRLYRTNYCSIQPPTYSYPKNDF